MARKHGGLGRGLDALIPMREEVEKAMSSAESEGVEILFADEEEDIPVVEKKEKVPQAESVSRETITFKEDVKPEVIKEKKEETPAAVKSPEINVDDLKDAVTVRISEVEPNRKQPRKNFDDEKLEELAESIKTFGLLQPILVQKRDGYYEIIAGERRWRTFPDREYSERESQSH